MDVGAWDSFANKYKWEKKTKDYLLVYIVGSADKIFEKAIEYAPKRGWNILFLGLNNPGKIHGGNMKH